MTAREGPLAPIVVVGAFRSASTLVAELLGSRPDCHYLGFELSEQISDATGVPFAAPGSDDRQCPPLGVGDASPRQRAAVRSMLRGRVDAEDVPPGAQVVVKNPHLWHRVDWVRALLPGARLVATVRDLLPTVASLKVLWQRSLRDHAHYHHLPTDPASCWDYLTPAEAAAIPADRTFPGGDVRVLARFWLRANGALAAAAQSGALTAFVRHERTLGSFEATCRRLQVALGFAPVALTPPEPVEAARQLEWRHRLTAVDRRSLEGFVDCHRQDLSRIDRVLDGRTVPTPRRSDGRGRRRSPGRTAP